ncbi:hypothetical protein [Truepera radiovictrix]|uniref:ECF transporter S component n=1 Tax=Truepera radiovictrix (strain DSM 17093 / CIP 108686 / LMG 22925 / RQ-24) TaxID=649638 RepID=D7CTE1_TRURR|nr:hypothetical protein [Truepera radiovictrix]ADI13798.1 conserved hypothetical protein [Truepera radiovictrix DSM 17093]WMT57637.1 hypothetical protein RCV51_01510 [Truepera radiovictrix]
MNRTESRTVNRASRRPLSPPLLISVTALTVAFTFALPLLFHLLPSPGIPLGARLLPIFYAPLLAAHFFPPVVAFVGGAVAPFVNHAVTGNPPLPLAAQLSAELLVFVGVLLLLRRRWPQFALSAPLAYLAARVVVFFAQQPAALISSDAWGGLFASLQVALPGLGALLVLDLVARSKHTWGKDV